MARSWKKEPGVKMVAEDLEPYRRLVELQKQMIELAEQHEQSKRKRDALREQMTREATNRLPGHRGLRHRLQWSAAKLLRRVPGFAQEKTGLTLITGNSIADAAQKVVKVVGK
ncbi:MAG: hypothetical protein ACLQAH_01175 [Limisphaerales bacterium]